MNAITDLTQGNPFPKGCVIKNIRRGDGYRARWIYANLYNPEGELLISATLEYINERLLKAGIE